jgi:hypothetical protein
MNRKDLITHNLSYIFLALAVLAVSMVLVSLIQPMELPVPYASSNKVSLVPVLNRGQQADAARWQGLADAYNHQRALQADAARWQGLADAYNHQRALQADTNRWQGLADAYKRQRAIQADTARWQGLAEETLKTSTATALTKAQQVDAARWKALANHYYFHNGGLSGYQIAEALRWTAMAFHYGVEPVKISPQLKFLLGK